MHYHIVSFSYKNSSVEVREKLDLSSEEKYLGFIEELLENDFFSEVLIQSTCNRIEIVSWVLDTQAATKMVVNALAARSRLTKEVLQDHADIFTNEGAIHHLFSVAASLDSLVIGETQIVGQMRDAYRNSFDRGFCGKELSKAMRSAFKCAACVREHTNISSKPVSIASIAVLQAKEAMGSFTNKKALVIGAGEMSRIATQYLVSHDCEVTLINRSMHKAEAIASEVGKGVRVEPFEALAQLINSHHLLITSTGASSAIITQDMVKPVEFKRFWFDLAVPRDIQIEHSLFIKQYIVDDLEEIAQSNRDFRQDEAKESFAIIKEQTKNYFESLNRNGVEPLIKVLYEKATVASKEESKRVVKRGYIPKEYAHAVEKATLQANKRFLHDLTQRIRELANHKDADKMIDSLQYLLEMNHQENLQE